MKAKNIPNWNNSKFEYADKKMKELVKKQNVIFEKSKFQFKKIANSKLNKIKKIDYKGFHFEQSDFIKQSRLLYFDELNELTISALVDVANKTYQETIKRIKEMFPDDKEIQNKKAQEIKRKMIVDWNNTYVLGLRTSYNDDLEMQSQYLAYRVSNALNENTSKMFNGEKIEDVEKKKKTSLKDRIVNMNAIPMLLAYKVQKKKFSNALDNAFINIVNLSDLEAYEYMGIEKVIRIAELDSRTCKYCEELNGEVYPIEEAPELIIHDFCRCIYEPYIEEYN